MSMILISIGNRITWGPDCMNSSKHILGLENWMPHSFHRLGKANPKGILMAIPHFPTIAHGLYHSSLQFWWTIDIQEWNPAHGLHCLHTWTHRLHCFFILFPTLLPIPQFQWECVVVRFIMLPVKFQIFGWYTSSSDIPNYSFIPSAMYCIAFYPFYVYHIYIYIYIYISDASLYNVCSYIYPQ